MFGGLGLVVRRRQLFVKILKSFVYCAWHGFVLSLSLDCMAELKQDRHSLYVDVQLMCVQNESPLFSALRIA